MAISANDVKTLRERTGAGMMDCKHALQESNGDMEKAIDWLRKKGLQKVEKKAGRETREESSSTIFIRAAVSAFWLKSTAKPILSPAPMIFRSLPRYRHAYCGVQADRCDAGRDPDQRRR
jgi:hypothetical protein